MIYLCLVISKGVKVDPEKIKSITDCPKPTNISKLRGFLGLTGYYRRFIQIYVHITAPLSNLLNKNAFQWNVEAEKHFESFEVIMSSTPILATPKFPKPFVIEFDALGYGLGALLMQDEHLIAFERRKLNNREQFEVYIR